MCGSFVHAIHFLSYAWWKRKKERYCSCCGSWVDSFNLAGRSISTCFKKLVILGAMVSTSLFHTAYIPLMHHTQHIFWGGQFLFVHQPINLILCNATLQCHSKTMITAPIWNKQKKTNMLKGAKNYILHLHTCMHWTRVVLTIPPKGVVLVACSTMCRAQ